MRLILSLLIITTLCAAGTKHRYTQLHLDSELERGFVPEGRRVLVFPLVYREWFYDHFSINELLESLLKRGDKIEPVDYSLVYPNLDSERQAIVKNKFQPALLQGNILDYTELLPVFLPDSVDFVLILRVLEMGNITPKEGKTFRKCTIEGELLDIRSSGAVWRGKNSLRSTSKGKTDRELLEACVNELAEYIPRFYFSTVREEW